MDIREIPVTLTPGHVPGPRLRAGDPAPAAQALDVDGQAVDLGSLWPYGPVLLVFLSHFGCMFCRQWLADLQEHATDLAQAGLLVVAVGLGQPQHAQRIGGRYAPDLTVLAAPNADPYAAFGIIRADPRQLLSPRTAVAGARAVLGGKLQGRPTGDQQMLGGAFVVDRQGVVRLAHYDAVAGDMPDLDRILALGRRLTRSAA